MKNWCLRINVQSIFIKISIKDVKETAILKWKTTGVKGFPEVELHERCIQSLLYILPVNYYLKKIKITENETCTYCESECETILHVFFMSTKVLHIGMI